MSGARSVPTATVTAILTDLAAGATLRDTARKYGVSVSTVSRYRDNAKLMVRYQRPAVTSARWQAAMALVRQHGLTLTEAARRMGVSQSHLSRHLTRTAPPDARDLTPVAGARTPTRQAVTERVNAGQSYYGIARDLNLTENQVRRYAEQAGVRSRYARR
jgi:DNA-binding NarL/FixJ family response regulator